MVHLLSFFKWPFSKYGFWKTILLMCAYNYKIFMCMISDHGHCMCHMVCEVRGQPCVTSCVWRSEGSHGMLASPSTSFGTKLWTAYWLSWELSRILPSLTFLPSGEPWDCSHALPRMPRAPLGGSELNSSYGLPGTLFRSHIHRPGMLFLKCILPYLSPKYESQHGHNREG